MNQNYGTPIPPLEEAPPQPKKGPNWLIIVIVVLVVLCCCCAVLGASGLLAVLQRRRAVGHLQPAASLAGCLRQPAG